MTPASETSVTRLLDQLQSGHREALDQLYPLVYHELKALAHYHRRRWHGDDTLGTTALLHESYLKAAGAAAAHRAESCPLLRRGGEGYAAHPEQLRRGPPAQEARW